MKYNILVDIESKEKARPMARNWSESSKVILKTKYFRRLRYRIMIFLLTSIFILYSTGLLVKPFEKNFSSFTYPIHRNNFRYLIQAVKANLKFSTDDFEPIYNKSEFNFHLNPAYKCRINNSFDDKESFSKKFDDNSSQNSIHLLIVVKSAVCNFHYRNSIRQTWGNEKRFIDYNIRTVFMLGECSQTDDDCPDHGTDGSETLKYPSWLYDIQKNDKKFVCNKLISHEAKQFNDIIQANFQDNYYNNTLKTIACFQWVNDNCLQAPFIFFVDDDYYLSVKNLINFIKNFFQFTTSSGPIDENGNTYLPEVIYDGRLYSGWVYPNSWPQRSIFSKWSVSLKSYPFSRYPPYITGGAFLMNSRTVSDIYYASLFTKRFDFDDVYLGILAWKMKIRLIHNQNMVCVRKDPNNNPDLIASHDYKDPEEMAKIWFQQKYLGFA